MADRSMDLEAIFSAALERSSPAERAAFLDGACSGDSALRERVEALLKAHQEAGTFLNPASEPESLVTPAAPLSEGPGTMIGRYKLLQLIGEGGFGMVYMAEQEEPVRRKVALKIIKLGMDTKQVIARFESERQALAIMDHPNIAKVLDAGATETGRPYFVMELVRGVPITEYCDSNNLGTRERLELFLLVCHAVQHAHLKGIIHRDIKPSNVLVTLHDGSPVPKVIDFGVAKATNQRLTQKTLFTEFRQFIGTPVYMSPEQAEMSGLDIDTRSDIYSLGVLLYELLTGTTPLDEKRLWEAGYAEMTRMIREEDPPTPSTRLSSLGDLLDGVARHRSAEPSALRRFLRGDVDWIVMKALEKDRTRRYETANAFAADILRHLENEPVLASQPGRMYKVGKFVRRNRTWVLTGSLMAAALILGLALATVGFIQASKDRDAAEIARGQAEAQAERSRAIIESLQGIIASVAPERLGELGADAQSVLNLARDVVSDASPLPVRFGKYADLDAFRTFNWDQLAESAEKMSALLQEVLHGMQEELPVDPNIYKAIQVENAQLARVAVALMGQLPTCSPINGEYTHPLTLINIMAALLERSGSPFSPAQKFKLAVVGNQYELEYDQLVAEYTEKTTRLRMVIDELELKRQCMGRFEQLLTADQSKVLIRKDTHHRLQMDLTSPVMMVTLHVKSRHFTSPETARDIMPHEIARSFDLTPRQTDSLKGAFDAWCRDVQPVLGKVVEKDSPPHIDEIIVSGRALANMLDAMLELPDLSDTLRSKIMTTGNWSVPRVVQRPIEELEKCIEELRGAREPDEKSLAKCLDELAAAFEERKDALQAIPPLMEAIRIRQRVLGDSWNPNPMRYRLRNLIRKRALEPDQPESLRELSEEAGMLVLELKPDSPTSHQVLGMIQHRLGKHAEAVESLQAADAQHREMYEGGLPVDVAFLAMSHQAMGNTEEAQAALARLRELMKSRAHTAEAENRKVLEEAESLFDEAGPAAPR